MSDGVEWLVDAGGCSPERLRDLQLIGRLCQQIIGDLALRVVGKPVWHQFPGPGGVTGMFLLTESHFTCHTYPEVGLASFNLYCCRPRPRWPWEQRLAAQLGASRVIVQAIPRGEGGIESDLFPHPMPALQEMEP